MPLNDSFTPSSLAREVNQGESTVRFWLNRFSPWFPHIVDRGQKRYLKQSIDTLLAIAEKIDEGMIPTQIEVFLKDRAHTDEKEAEARRNRQKNDGVTDKKLDMMQSLLGTMSTLHERIATAQERRAEAEEQKARAMERRAAAEEQKALAMNAIATALGKLNQGVPGDAPFPNAISEATRGAGLDPDLTPDLNQTPDTHSPRPGTEDLDHTMDDSSLSMANKSGVEEDPDIDDLSALFKDEPIQDLGFKDLHLDDLDLAVDDDAPDPLDNLGHLVDDDDPDPLDDLNRLVDDDDPDPLDNLGHLVDDDDPDPLDDLNRLVDDDDPDPLDDLGRLVDDDDPEPLDDLDRLVDDDNPDPLDDLDRLLDDDDPDPLDDLDRLVDDDDPEPLDRPVDPGENQTREEGYIGLDDLGMLVEEEAPTIKPDITPEQNFELYKSEIINIIIQLKNKGLSVDETTNRFNSDGVLTLSGKSKWSTKAIDQIYRFIDAVKR